MKISASAIARILQDFSQLEIKVMRGLPEELARLQIQIKELHPVGKPNPMARYNLFYRISHNLYQKSSLTMGELSSTFSMPLSTATGMVDWMVESGYLERLSDPEDRRVVRVALTAKGRKLYKMVENYIGHRFQQILSCLTVEEQNMLFAMIRRIAVATNELEG